MKLVSRVGAMLGMFVAWGIPAAPAASGEEARLRMLQKEMVEAQLMTRGISDPRVLEAMRKVPRHRFVPDWLQDDAYADTPLPIGHSQTISQPYIVAFMTEALRLEPTDRVLEIGTGSGYQAAILAELAREVYTIEILEPLYLEAKARLEKMGYHRVFFKHGDGWLGWEEFAPFDKIIVTAAPESVPQTLVDQLKEGGRLVVPVGGFRETQELIIGVKKNGSLKTIETIPVRFVPLIHGSEEEGRRA